MTVDHATTVRALLTAAGVTPDEAEIEALIAERPSRVAAVEAMHAVPEARYEEPAVVYSAVP
jgi:hypothetical protein